MPPSYSELPRYGDDLPMSFYDFERYAHLLDELILETTDQ